MANEVTASVTLLATKGGATVNMAHSFQVSMTGDDMLQNTQLIGTTAETLALGEITGAPSLILIRNLDAAHFVEIGGDEGLTVFKITIPAGQSRLISPAAVPIYAKADTAAVRVAICAVEA